MKHAITVRLNDRYEAEKILLDRIDAIHEKTHQPKGRIVTEMLTSQSSHPAELSDKDASRIAERAAAIVLEKLWEKLPAYLFGYAASAPASGQTAGEKNNPPVSAPGKPVLNEANPDFSKSTLDMEFIDM